MLLGEPRMLPPLFLIWILQSSLTDLGSNCTLATSIILHISSKWLLQVGILVTQNE